MIKISPDNIRLRIIFPFVIIIFLLVSLSLFTIYALQTQTLDDATRTAANQYKHAYKNALSQESELLKGLTSFIINDKDIQATWVEQDREALFSKTSDIFERLRNNHSITHFYFHQLDQYNFLRVHQPNRWGDKINRYTLEQAITNNKISTGIELGVFGRFVLRVVTPWYINGKLNGYIELGKEIENISHSIASSLQVQLIYAVNKSLIDKPVYDKYLKVLGRESTWDELQDEIIIDSTLPNFSELNWVFKQNNQNNYNKIIDIAFNGKHIHALWQPLRDASQNIVGRVLIAVDITVENSNLSKSLLYISITAILITLSTLIFYVLFIKKVEEKISTLVRNLSNEITEHENTEHKLRNSHQALQITNNELESYSYSIAHDLRTPLRAITSFSQILKEDADKKLNNEEKNSLDRIVKAGIYMSDLIDDILKLSKISRDKLEKQEIDLSKLAHEIISRIKVVSPHKNAQFNITDNMLIHGSPSMIAVLLENLLGNACKFSSTKSQPIIEFGFKNQNDKQIFFIKDNGTGFDMQYHDKLFDSFQRLHSDNEFDGNGIGLAMVKRIVHRHGGEIWAESTINQGATFYFTLPNL